MITVYVYKDLGITCEFGLLPKVFATKLYMNISFSKLYNTELLLRSIL